MLAKLHMQKLDPDSRHAVLGNAGMLILFRAGPEDAAILAKKFQTAFGFWDLLNLLNQYLYLMLKVDGTPAKTFSE